jgi:hypothetical protein
MKKLISNYTFNPAARTISFADYTSIDLEGLLLITNVTDNQIIYNFADPCFGGGVSGNTVTLTYDTTSMSSGDSLQIFYDDGGELASELTLQSLESMVDYLKSIFQHTKVLSTQDNNQRQRVVVENTLTMPTVTVQGTVAANTSSAYGELTVRQESSRLEFAQGIRANLVF